MSTPSQQLVKIDDTPKPLTKPQARALDKKVRAASDRVIKNLDDAANSWQKLVELLEQAVLEDVHTLLGYATWTAYFKDAVRLTFNDRAERKSLVLLMSDKGMSTRVIADILGISNATVSRDGSGVTAVTADNVVGIDGKKYPKKPAPEPEPEPPLDVDEVPIPEPESEPAPPKRRFP
jgi:Trp operon repressor